MNAGTNGTTNPRSPIRIRIYGKMKITRILAIVLFLAAKMEAWVATLPKEYLKTGDKLD
jgi:hypothetical protein